MSQQVRQQLLQALDELGRRFPDWRLGQLVENVAGWADVRTWDGEDEQLLAAAQYCLENSPPLTGEDRPTNGAMACPFPGSHGTA